MESGRTVRVARAQFSAFILDHQHAPALRGALQFEQVDLGRMAFHPLRCPEYILIDPRLRSPAAPHRLPEWRVQASNARNLRLLMAPNRVAAALAGATLSASAAQALWPFPEVFADFLGNSFDRRYRISLAR